MVNATVILSFLSAIIFTITAVALVIRRHNISLSAGAFAPLLVSILLYDFIVVSNFLEHSGITGYLDPLEDIAEIVFTLIFLFFVNNWRKDTSEARFRELFKLAPMSLTEVSRGGRIIEVNDVLSRKLFEFHGITPADIPTLDDWFNLAYPDPHYRDHVITAWRNAVDQAYDTGAEIDPDETEITCSDGIKRTMIVNTSIINEHLLLSLVDITDRKQEEAARAESLELLRATFDASPDGIVVVNRDRKVTQANGQFHKMWRIAEQLTDIKDEERLRAFMLDQLEDPSGTLAKIKRVYESGIQDVFEIFFKDGRIFECYGAPMILHGKEVGRVWGFRDISKQKAAEKEQANLQKQLLQAQKLEAIGVLAGGVAHDFNNMLGTIIGYAELMMTDMEADNPFREYVSKVLDAADRSTGLVRQLLIFARKQNVTPVVFDLNASVETLFKMLHRLLGENIELAWLPAETDCIVNMDPTQLDQILVNLCVNARDAIKDIGKITIKTGIASFDGMSCQPFVDCFPGEYVQLSVMDNGCGMDRKIMEHVFDPFFTTKEVGQGTGLGLATVYGIVKQNNGFTNLYSEPGVGTTFNIYLPLHEIEMLVEKPGAADAIPGAQGETILMVEDDPTLMDISRLMLERLGYSVITATTPGDALELAGKHSDAIDLFLTDVVMPEMNGRELIDLLLQIRPGVKFLFMSGYTADVIIPRGVSGEGDLFIQKPFSQKDIALKIREVLDGNLPSHGFEPV